jgi:hypothetical protein
MSFGTHYGRRIGGVIMRFHNTAAFGWIEDGKIKLRVGCKTHMKRARKSTAKAGSAVRLVCPSGCVLGEWKDKNQLMADLKKLRDRLVWEKV